MRIRRVPLPKFSSVFHTFTHTTVKANKQGIAVYLMHFCTREENEKHLISNERVRFFFFLLLHRKRTTAKKKKERKGGKKTLGPIASADQPLTLSLSRLTTFFFFFFCSCWSKQVDTSVTYASHSCRQEKSVLLNEARQQHLSKGPNTTTAPSTTAKKSWA